MQIREMTLKELYSIYDLVKQLRTELTYDEFEDLVYDMRHMNYKMIGLFEKEKLIVYAGVAVQTNLYHKRHLYIFDLVVDEHFRSSGFGKSMMEYLFDYSKMAACQNIVLSSGIQREDAHRFYKKEEFDKKSFLFVRAI